MIVGIVGMKGYGKTTYCRKQFAQYDFVIGIFGSIVIPSFRKAEKKIWRYTQIEKISDFYKIYDTITRKYKDAKIMLLFDDADFFLSDRYDEELNKLFVFSRNYKIDIFYNCKRLAGISSYVKYNTDMIIFFRYSRLFVKDLKDMKLSDDVIQKILTLEKFEYLALKL